MNKLELIEEQETKIASLLHILDSAKYWYNKAIDNKGKERLELRIKMRKDFIKSIKQLTTIN